MIFVMSSDARVTGNQPLRRKAHHLQGHPEHLDPREMMTLGVLTVNNVVHSSKINGKGDALIRWNQSVLTSGYEQSKLLFVITRTSSRPRRS